jgi:hypothetical protein
MKTVRLKNIHHRVVRTYWKIFPGGVSVSVKVVSEGKSDGKVTPIREFVTSKVFGVVQVRIFSMSRKNVAVAARTHF